MDDREDRRPEPRDRTKERGESVPELVYSRHRQQIAWGQATDLELLEALMEDDELALDELIRRKTSPLLQLAQRVVGDAEEARDIVQIAFFRMWENRSKYDRHFSPNTWIYRIVSNLAIDHLRSRRSRERVAEPVRHHLRAVADERSGKELAHLTEAEVATIFHQLAAGLTEKQRLIFLLREVEGLPSQEVAEIAGCQESTVRNHLFNARKVLRTELVKRYPEYAPESAVREAGMGEVGMGEVGVPGRRSSP